MSEANARIIIDRLLRESEWVLSGDGGVVNVDTEMQNQAGFADYVLKDNSDFPLCIIEAKKELVSPLVGKEQARGYAESLNCRFVILSNGVSHYFWDIEQGSPTVIDIFPSQEQLELRKTNFNPPRQEVEDESTIHVVMNTPSMKVLQQHMENEAELIASAGGSTNPEDNIITLCSD